MSDQPASTQNPHMAADLLASRIRSPRLLFALPLLVLLLAASLALGFLPPSAALTFDVGTPGDSRFAWGFFPAEQHAAATFRWSGPETRLVLHGVSSGIPAEIMLRLHGNQFAPSGQRRLRIDAMDTNGVARQALASMEVAPQWRVYRLIAAGQSLQGAAQPVTLALKSDTHRPGAADGRDLGVAVDWVRVTYLQNTPASAGAVLFRITYLAWFFTVLAGLLWHIDRVILPQHQHSRMLRSCLAVAIAGMGLLAWMRRDPSTTAWVLPAMPWTLGLATIGLCGPAVVTTQVPAGAPGLRSRPKIKRGTLWIGLGPVLIAQILFNTQQAIGVGMLLLMVGVVLLWRHGMGEQTAGATAHREEQHGDTSIPLAPILLGAIFVLALGLRLYRITDLPYGLWRDEARHGLVALKMLEDPRYHPVFIPENGVDLPALGLYPFALALKIGGIHPWSMRVITALAGALTVFPLYGVARRLTGRRGVALVSAALLAVSSWHLTISRFSFPTVFDPLFTLTGLWLLLLGLPQGESVHARLPAGSRWRMLACLGAGACVGAALQTYHTGRLAPLVAAVLALFLLLRDRRNWRRWLAGMSAFGLGCFLVAGPLVAYALRNPETFNARVNYVFLLGDTARQGQAPLAVLDAAVGRHLLMFNVRGDSNGRHHAPNRPMLDFVSGLGFLLGCAILLRNWRTWCHWFLLIGLALGVLPSLVAVESPHAMRSIDALPFACVVAAIGWGDVWRLLHRNNPNSPFRSRGGRWLSGAAAVLLVLALGLNGRTYFVEMPVNPDVWMSFYPVHTQVGTYLRTLADTRGTQMLRQVFVPESLAENPVFTYLTHRLPVETFNDSTLPSRVPPGAIVILSGYSYQKDFPKLAAYLDSTAVLRGPDLPGTTRPAFVGYTRK